MSNKVASLIREFLRICALQSGPHSIPASPLLLAASVLLWLVVLLMLNAIFDTFGVRNSVTAIVSMLFGLASFQLVLAVTGKTSRMLPMQTSLIGVSAVLTTVIMLALFLGNQFDGGLRRALHIGAELTWFWSVPVKGHILSRAANLHWYVGILIAGIVFVAQFAFAQYANAM